MNDLRTAGPANRDAPVTADGDEIDLAELMRTIWRGKFWIILCVLIAFVIGFYYAFVKAVPVYTSSSVVMLESRQEQVADLESVMSGLSGDQATINTEVEVIRSRGLVKKLVRQLDLIEDPEFNPQLRPEPAFSLGKAFGALRNLMGGSATEEDPDPQKTLNTVIDNVVDAISVTNVRQSYVFEITAVTEGPRKSAKIANTLADLYIQEQLDVKFAATEKATEWLSERVSELQVELEEAVAAVKDFNAGTD